MNNTLDALRNLYVACGGTLSDVENLVIIPDLLNAIAEIMGVDIASINAQFSPFIIEVTQDGATFEADTSYDDISAAYEEGKRLVLKMTIDEIVGYAELQVLMGTAFVFVADDYVNHVHYVVGIDSDESVTVGAYTLTPVGSTEN